MKYGDYHTFWLKNASFKLNVSTFSLRNQSVCQQIVCVIVSLINNIGMS